MAGVGSAHTPGTGAHHPHSGHTGVLVLVPVRPASPQGAGHGCSPNPQPPTAAGGTGPVPPAVQRCEGWTPCSMSRVRVGAHVCRTETAAVAAVAPGRAASLGGTRGRCPSFRHAAVSSEQRGLRTRRWWAGATWRLHCWPWRAPGPPPAASPSSVLGVIPCVRLAESLVVLPQTRGCPA